MFSNGQKITARIYCIKHEDTPIYVGCTTRFLEERLMQHFAKARLNAETDFLKFLVDNRNVTIHLIEEVSFIYDDRFGLQQGLMIEAYWIKEYRRLGRPLFNSTVRGKKSINYIPTNTNLSDNLRNARNRKRLSQKQVSEIVGIKRSLLGAYEEGRAKPALATLIKFCQLYGIGRVEELLNDIIQPQQISTAA